ncbi:MAG TPA: DUF58 domain-containing protein [Planctomycetota bacterium]|nr:DUF58 domain-containing protein [Planctomycetota bacterium]
MANIFDPHVIGRVKGLELRSMRLVESFLVGMHKSRLRGISTDFAQHRQYVTGDDTRHLDWKVFAKTDRFYVKEYEVETNMPVFFLLDASPSMFFKSDDAAMSKFEYAATIVATLAHLLMQQKDAFGLAIFDEKMRSLLPARSSGAHYRHVLNALESAAPGGTTNLGNALLTLGPQLKQAGLVLIVSDCVDDTDRLGLGFGQMSFAGQDVVLFHIEDPAERDFPFSGQTILLGLEGEGKLLCDPRDLRITYLAERARHINAIRSAALRFGYSMEEMPTDARLDAMLAGMLSLRLDRRKQR